MHSYIILQDCIAVRRNEENIQFGHNNHSLFFFWKIKKTCGIHKDNQSRKTISHMREKLMIEAYRM